jgi:Glycosyl hydrolase family 26
LSERQHATLVAVLAAALLCVSPTAEASMYWGGTIKGAVYGESGDAPTSQTVLEKFERDAGKKITFVNTRQSWASFDTTTMHAAIDAGAIPLVTMGLPQGVTLAEVAAGGQDTQIRAWAKEAKAWGYPFLFRPWWEMNGDWYAWGRDPDFVAAWRHFHDLVEEEGATNVTWAWVVNSVWRDPASDPTPYYPGDAYVDWVGMDAYNWGLNPLQPDRWLTPEQTIGPTLEVLERIAPGKPVCICEDASTEIGGNKPSWIREMLSSYLPHHPQIKAYLWFNWNVEQNGGRWDWPIESSASAEQAFRNGIQSSAYLSSLPPLVPLGKVPLPVEGAAGPSPSGPTNPPLPDGEWSQAANLSPGGSEARDPRVAMGPDGKATLAWVQYDGSDYVIEERQIEPGGKPIGSVHILSDPGEDAFDPQVAVDPNGTATVAWKRFDGSNNVVQERRVGPDGAPEPAVHDLSESGQYASQPQVGVSPDGRAIVVWERYSGYRTVIQERQIYASGVPAGTTYSLSTGEQNAVEPRVAVAPDGSATVVWDRYDGANQIVQERRIAPGGAPEEPTHDLSAGGENAIEPRVSVDTEGAVTAVWTRFDGSNEVIQARHIAPSGALSPTVYNVSAAGKPAVSPDVAMGPDGSATLVWQRFDRSNFVVQERRIAPDGSLDPGTYDLSPIGEDAHEPQIAVGGDGSATVAWSGFDGSSGIVRARRVGQPGLPQAETADLSTVGGNAGAPAIAAGPRSEVIATWRRFDGANDGVQSASFGAPVVEVTPATHDFGAMVLGSSPPPPQEFRVTNTGGGDLTIASARLSGDDPGQFDLSGAPSCTGSPLPRGSSCEVSVGFAPNASGAYRAELQVLGNAPSSPDVASLSGSATPPPSTDSPTSGSALPAMTFALGAARLRARGRAAIPVIVPGPGSIDVAVKNVLVRISGRIVTASRSHHATISAAGTAMLRLAATGHARQALLRRGTVRVRGSVAYTPASGSRRTKALTLVLKSKR